MPDVTLADELARQRLILRSEMPERILLTSLAFFFCGVFANPWPIAGLWALYVALEFVGNWLLAPERLARSAIGYRLALAQTVLVEATYISGAGLVWQVEDPYSKALAVGLTSLTLMHLATVRSIHLPIGLAGLGGVAAAGLFYNTVFWGAKGDAAGLALSSAAALGALAYTFTAMLSNHRLHRTMSANEASARAAHDAKTLFLAQMSHELRTPLNAIIGMGQAELTEARAEGANAPPRERLQTLVESARMLAVILDDVTDMNAVSHNQLALRLRVVNLDEEVQTILAGLRVRAERLGIPVTFHSDQSLPKHAEIDTVRLRQSLGNLFSNAIRHARGGQISVTQRFAQTKDPTRGLLVFMVSDTGPGVPYAQHETIFDAFHKGRAAAPGAGLGLGIARTLARRMGGDLVLLPSVKGASFQLSIACRIADPPLAQPDLLPDLTGRLILVVDDIASNRLVAASYLRHMGALVIEAATGEAALSVLAAEEVDLVLLDMNMPGLDGFETAARARQMGGRVATIPIVAMTADVMGDQIAAFHRAGFDGYLAKPLLPETVATEIARLI